MLKHDIYSFGVVLLNLGLWDDLDLSWKGTLKTRPVNNEATSVVYERLHSFTDRLGFYVGSCYAEAVENCLQDACFEGASDRETPGISIDKVLNKIHKGDGL